MRNTEYIMKSEKARAGNTGLAKVEVQFLAETFVIKIDIFAKLRNVIT